MKKYESMVIHNRDSNEQKAKGALSAMESLYNSNEKVTVLKLVEMTGLSRSYFYNNTTIHNKLLHYQELQKGKNFVGQRNVAINKAKDKEISILRKLSDKLVNQIAQLQTENERLRKTAKAKTISVLNSL